jgi:asparagine synthase (glutamine-hydrolysing)
MCGILAVIGKEDPIVVQDLASRMRHRGPDERDMHVDPCGSVLCHERLSIIDLNTGLQPIKGTHSAYVIHNGEIYNHQQLRDTILKHHVFHTTCDSEVIVHLYEEFGFDFCQYLDGDFAFVVVDGEKFVAGRDPVGVKPLYYGKAANGSLYFASEMKSLADRCVEFEAFPPGHYYSSEKGLQKYYRPEWEDHTKCTQPEDLSRVRDVLINATRKRLMSDVPLGVLLSGGLDSSLISSITSRLLAGTDQELHSFTVGLGPDAPDLKYARMVADFIGTKHHEVYFSVEQGLAVIDKLIWHLESYDVTTIRASTPMYFLAEYITKMGIKVVLSGEGADEDFGGYLYFYNAPSDDDFQQETIRRVKLLSTADCLRADKSTMAHGLEVRVPFLDWYLHDVVMSIHPRYKRPDRNAGIIEKHILRAAFDDKENPYLPSEILWRQKEQFSDGVGYSWITGIIDFCEKAISDEEFSLAALKYPHNTPATKEAYYFRRIFEKHFPQPQAAKTVLKWVPKWQKNADPSGRVADHHINKVDDVQKKTKVMA